MTDKMSNRSLTIAAQAKVAAKKQAEEQARRVARALAPAAPVVRRRRGLAEPAWGRADVRAAKDADAAAVQPRSPDDGRSR